MNVLALDTSNRPLSIAIVNDQKVLATTTTTLHRKHAQYVLPIVQDLMAHAQLQPEDLQRVVVSDGPGSYTGIRVAVSVGKVLAFTLGIDLVGVSSLQTLALNVQTEGQLVNPVFDARNNNVFTGLYRIKQGRPEVVIPDQHTSVDDWLKQLAQYDEPIIGLGDANHFKALSESQHYQFRKGMANLPQAASLGLLGESSQPVKNIDAFIPRYLRLTPAEAAWRAKHPKEDANSYVEKI